MAELVKKLKLPKPDGFLYFVEDDCSVWKHKGGHKELISRVQMTERKVIFILLMLTET